MPEQALAQYNQQDRCRVQATAVVQRLDYHGLRGLRSMRPRASVMSSALTSRCVTSRIARAKPDGAHTPARSTRQAIDRGPRRTISTTSSCYSAARWGRMLCTSRGPQRAHAHWHHPPRAGRHCRRERKSQPPPDTDLAHAATERISAVAPGGVDEFSRSAEHRADGASQSLRKAERNGVAVAREPRRVGPGGGLGVEDARPVKVHGDAVSRAALVRLSIVSDGSAAPRQRLWVLSRHRRLVTGA